MKKTTVDYEFGGTIDVGAYSSVAVVTERSTQQKYAAKIVSKKRLLVNGVDPESAIRERDLLMLCREKMVPGIVKLHHTFQDDWSLYYILDYCEYGNIKDYSRSNPETSLELKLRWLQQICVSLAFLHDLNILHGDIKPENCLLDKNFDVLICDFNSAVQLDSDQTKTRYSRGSSSFLSPEAIRTNERGLSCDVWALGCLIYEVITQVCPFKAETEYLSFQRIENNDFHWAAPLRTPEARFSDSNPNPSEKRYDLLADLITQCWNRDPKLRITAKEAAQHPLFSCLL